MWAKLVSATSYNDTVLLYGLAESCILIGWLAARKKLVSGPRVRSFL